MDDLDGSIDTPGHALMRVLMTVREVDKAAGMVLSMNVALEREVDRCLAEFLPRAHLIKRVGYEGKIHVLRATCEGQNADAVAVALLAFNAYRNAVAHDNAKDVVAKRNAVAQAMAPLVPGWPASWEVDLAAVHIAVALGQLREARRPV